MAYFGESELFVGHELDRGFVDVSSSFVVSRFDLFECCVLKPYCR